MANQGSSAGAAEWPRRPWLPAEFHTESGVKVLRELTLLQGYTTFVPKIRAAVKASVRRGLLAAPNDIYSFPKELAYVEDMESWSQISGQPGYAQTSHEVLFLKKNAENIVRQITTKNNSSAKIVLIDLGPACSDKITYLIEEFGKPKGGFHRVKYVAVNINKKSLEGQVHFIRQKYGKKIQAMGLLGLFEDADRYYEQIDGVRVFCSFGSIFFNGPDNVIERRCGEMAGHLRPADFLLVRQDCPHYIQDNEYDNETYRGFIFSCLRGVHRYAGIQGTELDELKGCWSLKAEPSPDKDVWLATALKKMTCTHLDNCIIPKGQQLRLFQSRKQIVSFCQPEEGRGGWSKF